MYLGRTERRASIRFSKHIPYNLCLKGSKLFTILIIKNVMDSEHTMNSAKTFKINKYSTLERSFQPCISDPTFTYRKCGKLLVTMVK